MRYIIILTLLTFVLVYSEDKPRIKILGTRISVDQIEGFDVEDFFPSLVNNKDQSHIFFNEALIDSAKMVRGYVKSNPDKNNEWRLLNTPKFTTIGTYSGILLNFYFESGLIHKSRSESQIFISGDSIQSFAVGFLCRDSLVNKYKSIFEKTIQSLIWDTQKKLIPMDLYDFTIEKKGTLKVSEYTPISVVYTPYGLQIDSLVSIPALFLNMIKTYRMTLTEEKEQTMLESQIEYSHENISIDKVVEFQKIVVDGIRGYESVSLGTNKYTDSSIVVYSAILFYPVNYIGFIGFVKPSERGEYITMYKEIVRSFSRNTEEDDSKSVCNNLIRLGKINEALHCIENDLKINPQSINSRIGKARVLTLQNKYQDAIAIYSKIIYEDPNSGIAYIGRARTSFAAKQYADALKDYDKGIEFNINDTTLISERAETKIKLGNIHGAILDYRKLIDMCHNKASLYCTIGTLQSEVLEHEAALNSFASALTFDKDMLKIYEERGTTYNKLRKYKEALADYNQALHLNPKTKNIFIHRAKIKRIIGDLVGALVDCNMFINSGKKTSEGLVERGKIFCLSGDFNSAISDFSKAIIEDSEDYTILNYRGVANFFLGKYIAASSDFRNSAFGAESRLWLYMAESKGYNNQSAKRNLTMYKNGIVDNPNTLDRLLVQFFLNEISEEELFNKIKEKKGSSFRSSKENEASYLCDVAFFSGLKYYFSNQKVAAKNQWKKCLETNQQSNFNYQIARAYISGTIK